MFRKIALFTASAALMTGLAACGGETDGSSADNPYQLITPGTISAVTQPDQPPYVVVAQGAAKPEGFAVDLAEEAAKRLGLKVQYKITNLQDILAGLSANQYDMGVAGIVTTEERKRNVDFVKPIGWDYVAVMTKTSAREAGLADFGGEKVGVVSGSIQEPFARAMMPAITLIQFPDKLSAVAQLLSGEIDAFAVTGATAEEYIKKETTLKIAVETENFQGTSLPIKKGNAALVKALDTKIDEMVADGTFMTFYKKWYSRPLSARIVEFRPGLAEAIKATG